MENKLQIISEERERKKLKWFLVFESITNMLHVPA